MARRVKFKQYEMNGDVFLIKMPFFKRRRNKMKRTLCLGLILSVALHAQMVISDLGNVNGSVPTQSSDGAPTVYPVRSTYWYLPAGNLVANWSFENSQEFWNPGINGFNFNLPAADVRVRSSSAHSGYFVGQGIAGAGGPGLISNYVYLRASQTYTLSFFYQGVLTTPSGTLAPQVVFYEPNTNSSNLPLPFGQSVLGPNFSVATSWTEYRLTFTTPGNRDCLAQVQLFTGTVPSTFKNFIFDDVTLVEGNASSPSLNRSQILTSISVSDPTGVLLNSADGSGQDVNYLAQTQDYDNFWRPNKSYLPFPVTPSLAASEIMSPQPSAQSAWPAAGNSPFSQTIYPTTSSIGQAQTTINGDPWAIGSGHTSAKGEILVTSVPNTADQLPTQSFETYHEPPLTYTPPPLTTPSIFGLPTIVLMRFSPEIVPTEKAFMLTWNRDADQSYTLSWSDATGRVVQTAKLLDKSNQPISAQTQSPNPSLWNWAFTTYQDYPNGKLKSVVLPPSSSGPVLPTITSYDFQGRVIATSSPDEGLTQFWYDEAGRLRYWHTATMQDAAGIWVAWRAYDAEGRPTKEGVCRPNLGLTKLQTMAEISGSEQSQSFVNSATYTKGWIYDNLNQADFQERTSVPLVSVVGITNFSGSNGQSRLVAKYNINPFYSPTMAYDPDLSTPAAKLVVELYSYDGYQRPQILGKYIGGITDPTMRTQSIEYRYDSAGRVANLLVDKNMSQTILADGNRAEDANYFYSYDDKGRVYLIQDSALSVANYQYDFYNRLSAVKLGNLHIAPIITALTYHLHGQVLSSNTTVSGNASYLEELGYESAQLDPVSTTVNAPAASYDGRITQAVHQFGTDLDMVDPTKAPGTQTVKAVNYTYDPAGRMTAVQTFIPQNNVSYSQNGFASLQVPFDNNSVLNLSASYTYDGEDRLSNVKWASAPENSYNYKPGSNQLDNVAGIIEPGSARDASAPSTFSYDAAGRMIQDNSQYKDIAYGYDGLPTTLHSRLVNGPLNVYIYPLYDADGQMASYVDAVENPTTQGMVGKYHYIRLAGFNHKEINESWHVYNNKGTASYNNSFVLLNYRGLNATVGRKFPGNSSLQRQFLVKDHQGSTIRLVNENGTTGGAFDYEAYGDVRTLSGEATNLTQKYTGKEFFPGLGLAYFGARWYDPQLGLWTTPDPMHQFNSPYAFSTGPLNSIDPTGMDDCGACGADLAASQSASAAADATNGGGFGGFATSGMTGYEYYRPSDFSFGGGGNLEKQVMDLSGNDAPADGSLPVWLGSNTSASSPVIVHGTTPSHGGDMESSNAGISRPDGYGSNSYSVESEAHFSGLRSSGGSFQAASPEGLSAFDKIGLAATEAGLLASTAEGYANGESGANNLIRLSGYVSVGAGYIGVVGSMGEILNSKGNTSDQIHGSVSGGVGLIGLWSQNYLPKFIPTIAELSPVAGEVAVPIIGAAVTLYSIGDMIYTLDGHPLQWTSQSNSLGNDATASSPFFPPTPIATSSVKIMQGY
jgi:RHS repeat-associated protein